MPSRIIRTSYQSGGVSWILLELSLSPPHTISPLFDTRAAAAARALDSAPAATENCHPPMKTKPSGSRGTGASLKRFQKVAFRCIHLGPPIPEAAHLVWRTDHGTYLGKG